MSYQSRQIFKYSTAVAIGMTVGILAAKATIDHQVITKTVEVMPKQNYCAMTVDYDNGILDRYENKARYETQQWYDNVIEARTQVATKCADSIKGVN